MNQHELENYQIINLSVEENQAFIALNILHLRDLSQVLHIIYSENNIDMLQIAGNHLSFVINDTGVESLRLILEPFVDKLINNLVVTHNLTKVSLIGSGFRSNTKLNQQVWGLLEDTEVFAISHNELSISMLVHNWEAAAVRNKLSQVLLDCIKSV